MASRHLAGYLKKCFTGWLEGLREGERRDVLAALIDDQRHEDGLDQGWLRDFEVCVAREFGEDALELTVDPDPEESGMVQITFASFIPRLRFHFALNLESSTPIPLHRIIGEPIDDHDADVAWFAIGCDSFASAISESGDPLTWFHEHRDEVEEAMALGESSSSEELD
jgi:hypothetical protein